jgi:GH43 family beta-xylosidase
MGTDTGASSSASSASGLPIHNEFRNPLNTGPDPFMTFYDGNYYLATTQGDAVRIWKAPSLGELLAAPATTVWQDGDPSRNQQVWAPSFYLMNGHWYVYYTADDGVDDHHRLYVVESDGTDPLGPYHFKAKLAPPGNENDWAIDPVLFQQTGGLYLAWSGAGTEGHNLIYIAPLSDPWTVSAARTYLGSAGGCPEVREAPAILQHGGTTFLVYSTCDTGKPDYQLWVQSIPTNGDPMNPSNWAQRQGAAFARNDATGVWGPGSNGFFKSPDGTEDWIVYHGKNTSQYTYDARTTRAQKIDWNGDGTPNLGAPLAAGATQALPSGDPASGAYWINDTGTNNGPGMVTYDGNWTAYPNCGVQCFFGDDHGTAQAGASVTVTFTGTQIALLSARDTGNGTGAISIDGGAEQTVDYYMPIRQGEQLIYVSPHLTFGPHTLKVRATGDKNPSSAGISISFDRAEVYTN